MQFLLRDLRVLIYGSSLILSILFFLYFYLVTTSDRLLIIRLTQSFAFTSIGFLYFTLWISPFTQFFKDFPYKSNFIYSRRGLGISAFYFATLHASLAFFGQLGGFKGLLFLSSAYLIPVLIGFTALIILLMLALTSNNFMIRKLEGRKWKYIHRFVYLAAMLIVTHALLIGSHFRQLGLLTLALYCLMYLLIGAELWRFTYFLRNSYSLSARVANSVSIVGFLTFSILLYWVRIYHV